ncbi:MAG: hypothetical protein K2X07_08195, partial [Caulobacteraceae bacterium]|nr:hypothetical protein [Caulobacteraceae bacterium]
MRRPEEPPRQGSGAARWSAALALAVGAQAALVLGLSLRRPEAPPPEPPITLIQLMAPEPPSPPAPEPDEAPAAEGPAADAPEAAPDPEP